MKGKVSLLLAEPSLRLPRFCVLVGFLAVGAGYLPFVGYQGTYTSSLNFMDIVAFVGFALFGIASSAWLLALSRREGGFRGMRPTLRLFAAACLVSGIAYLGLVHELIDEYRMSLHFGLRIQAISNGLSLLGFCSAVVGFWIAARTAGSNETAPLDSASSASDPATSQ